MCLAIPVEVKKILSANEALVEIGGVQKQISLALVDDVQVGDYVILHVGFALQKIDPKEACRTIELFSSARSGDAE